MPNLYAARRDIYREVLGRFDEGESLSWVGDPDLIPDIAVEATGVNTLEGMCGSLATWMSFELGSWSTSVHGKTGLRDIFEKHELTNAERVKTREIINERPSLPYVPGMNVIGQLHGVIPRIATREERVKEEWAELGWQSREFGAAISKYGTDVQGCFMEWLRLNNGSGFDLDPAKVRLDEETGITTVAPFADVLDVTREVCADRNFTGMGEKACVALQAGSPVEGCKTFFDAVWNSYSMTAERLIYPRIEIDPAEVPAEGGPWPMDDVRAFVAACS